MRIKLLISCLKNLLIIFNLKDHDALSEAATDLSAIASFYSERQNYSHQKTEEPKKIKSKVLKSAVRPPLILDFEHE